MRKLCVFLACIFFYISHVWAQKPSAYLSEYTTSKSQELRSCTGDSGVQFVPGQIVVEFKMEATDDRKHQLETAIDARVLKILPAYSTQLPNGNQIQFEELRLYALKGTNRGFTKESLDTVLEIARNFPGVRFAEPNIVYRAAANVSNDKYYADGLLWGNYSDDVPSPIGPPNTTSLFGSQAEKAWANNHVGSAHLYAAVIDSGIQVDHPDLIDNVDAADSKDFYYGDQAVVDISEYAHGTHVAGTIGAIGGNSIGVVGVVWSVQMISAKFLGPDGTGNLTDAVAAIRYLTLLKTSKRRQIVVLNNSWYSKTFSAELLAAIKNAARADMVVVAAAGNSCSDNDDEPSYPASYDTRDTLDNTAGLEYNDVISVAAIDKNGDLPQFSNYGFKSVHLGAPGVDIYSTYAGNPGNYQMMSGTSMAAAFVSGAVVLYASTHPQANAKKMIEAILQTATQTPTLFKKTITGGRLNVASF